MLIIALLIATAVPLIFLYIIYRLDLYKPGPFIILSLVSFGGEWPLLAPTMSTHGFRISAP